MGRWLGVALAALLLGCVGTAPAPREAVANVVAERPPPASARPAEGEAPPRPSNRSSALLRPDLFARIATKHVTPVRPPLGVLYSRYKAPLGYSPTTLGTRRGTATAYQIGLPPLPFPYVTWGLDLVAWGDASIEAAARRAGITTVTHGDYEAEIILGIFRVFTVEVYGD